MSRLRLAPLVALAALGAIPACGPALEPVPGTPPAGSVAPPPVALPIEAPPLGRLPADVRPTRYRLELDVDPDRGRFSGAVDIAVELGQLRDVIWLHGRDLEVSSATVQPEGFPPLAARWEQVTKGGVAALRLASPVGPGRAVLRLVYTAPFGPPEEGLSVAERNGARFAFSQMEAISARRVFPSFDEPGAKTPFEIGVHVPKGRLAVSNTREASRTPDATGTRFAFVATEPLPTYLVALGVGPLALTDGPAIAPAPGRDRAVPLRAVHVPGREKDARYALDRAGAMVTSLEKYLGVPYPYDKLDLLAVPDKGGAMENAGAITFAESILLFDPASPTAEQRASYYLTGAHEIAHQWFGDLVTARWWDDLWLNEAFATWAEERVVSEVAPDLHPELYALRATHRAMDADSLMSARKIRQEIASEGDIESAFDSITYEKGAAVIAMFERFMGPAAFQRGLRAHFAKHRHGNASADDLLAALTEAAGRDVATPFRTFLDQPGLPFVEARLDCAGPPRLLLSQSRFVPVGSGGDTTGTWQIPVCARTPQGERCTLLTERQGSLPLGESCPAWVMPNAEALGYYRWTLASGDTQKLAHGGLAALSPRERLSFAESIKAGYVRAALSAEDTLAALAPLAGDENGEVALAPTEILRGFHDWFGADPLAAGVEAYARKLYGKAGKELGWEAKPGEDSSRALFRQRVLGFLTSVARDPEVRKQAAARGRAWIEGRPGAPPPDLAAIAVPVAIEEGDAALFHALRARLAGEQRPRERRIILSGLGAARKPDLAAEARAMALDPKAGLIPRELLAPLWAQLQVPAMREETWVWVKANLPALLARLPESWGTGLVWMPAVFCETKRLEEIDKIIAPKVSAVPTAAREIAETKEEIRLCAARRAAHEASGRRFFGKGGKEAQKKR
jgi:alanyl aminopeptidase